MNLKTNPDCSLELPRRIEDSKTNMDDLAKEIAELKQFIVELKADRAAAKEKEKREAWTKYVSVTVVFIAVLSSIASQWAGKYGARTEANELHAFDQWNYYEALSIKQHTDEIGLPLLRRASGVDADGKNVRAAG